MSALRALALVCTLKPTPMSSSSELMAQQILDALRNEDVETSTIRVVDHQVAPGVQIDMGSGDQWPQLRAQVVAADILVFSTPTWLGHMSGVAQRVLERLDAELSEVDRQGRPSMFNKVAVAAVTGNEDGAHKIIADLFQALNDIGFTIPTQGATYWNNEAMNPKDYNELKSTPEPVANSIATLARNAIHLVTLLRTHPYPPMSENPPSIRQVSL